MNLHNIRTSQLNNDLVEEYPYFILELKEATMNYTRIRRKDFSMIQIIRVLECLKGGDLNFSNYFKSSGFGMKRSFINYIDFCINFKLIEKEQVGHSMIYHLKDKGKIFLEMFRNASS